MHKIFTDLMWQISLQLSHKVAREIASTADVLRARELGSTIGRTSRRYQARRDYLSHD